jgi:HEAT repeat protein
MTRYTLLLILFLLSASKGGASQTAKGNSDSTVIPETTYSAEPAIKADIPLDYEINETNVKGFITSLKDRFPVQLGAFRLKYNAEAFLEEVRSHIDKDAIMFREDGLYKIRITKTPEPERTDTPESNETKAQQIPLPDETSLNNDTANTAVSNAGSTGAVEVIPEPVKVTETSSNEAQGKLIIGNNSPWLKRITYFGKSLALINALIITIVVCIISMIILLIAILLNRRRMEKREKLHQYLMEKYQELIINYLFGNASPEEFRPIASDTYRRQVLIDQMIDVSINLKGEEARKLLGLYKHLGLDRDSIIRAHDRRWHKKIKGFRELAFMNIKDANNAIYKALNSSNEILRMEAQIALVRLGDDDPFEFLSKLTRPFSLWEQISLHELIVQHNLAVPPFSKWLTSSNPTVVMFALRMIREFKQADAEETVHDTLMHPDPAIRQLAVQVAGDLNMRSTLETMKHMYKFQDYSVGLEIIRSMGKMPDPSMMGFLKLVLDKEDDVQLQIEATKAIENNGEEGVKALVKIMKSEYKNYNIIVRHVLDRRIF